MQNPTVTLCSPDGGTETIACAKRAQNAHRAGTVAAFLDFVQKSLWTSSWIISGTISGTISWTILGQNLESRGQSLGQSPRKSLGKSRGQSRGKSPVQYHGQNAQRAGTVAVIPDFVQKMSTRLSKNCPRDCHRDCP